MIEKGQIDWCALDPVVGHSPLAAIVPLTTAQAKNPIHLTFTPGETGLDAPSTALVDHARFIDRKRLRGAPIGRLQPPALAGLNRHLARVFGL